MAGSFLDVLVGIDRQELLAASRRRKFARNDTIFHEGDPGESLHVVAKGYVAIRTTTELGDVVTLTVLGPGEPFGELAMLTSHAARSASAVALSPVETLSWQRAKVDELRTASHEFDRFLLEILAGQVRTLTGQLVEALHFPVEIRVLRRLSGLAELYDPDAETALIPVTQEDLASMAGTTRPSANRVLKEAEGEGILVLRRGRIEVVDRSGLARRAGTGR